MALLTGSLPSTFRVSSSPRILPHSHHQLRLSQVTFRTNNNRSNLQGASSRRRLATGVAMADANTTSGSRVEVKLGVRIERGPSESRLQELGIRSWPKWGCPASKFPWTYDGKETCYLLKGKVKVYPEGSGSEFVEFGAGDLVVFPKGMSCTWEVSEAVDKHYEFEY